jgi:hypothetical protein
VRCKDWSHADHVVCKHAVESAEMLGWDGGIRDAKECGGAGVKQRGELVVVEKSAVALKVPIQIVFQCCAR